ncbi:hypothetical protein [Paraburkholderia sediminicola]|uniref:hypothetical protein n=1 Tax=Paraburkholderia sediminicola TaxID=458836 RepID=UPI0038B9F49C
MADASGGGGLAKPDDHLYGKRLSPSERVRLAVEAMKCGSKAALNIIRLLATGVDVARFSRETGITKDTPWNATIFRNWMDGLPDRSQALAA